MNSKIQEMQKAILGEGLDGWLFCNYRHRDKLADELLGINPHTVNSRLWLYAVPSSGEALGILHAIEPDSLGTGQSMLPGQRVFYSSREELLQKLSALTGKRWGIHYSDTIPAISYIDAGTARMLEQAGLLTASAAPLIQRFKGLLNDDQIQSHLKAADHLYEIVETAWNRVRLSYNERTKLCEGDLRSLIRGEFSRRGLVCEHNPIVAAGINSANPHYDFNDDGALIKENDIIQFDIWAKDSSPGGIYADISWLGVYSHTVPDWAAQAFEKLLCARDGAYCFIKNELNAGRRPSGEAVDRKTRALLCERGCGGALRHRTGHGIDTEVHGSGVNIDSVEFPDSRLLLEGSCFSLEPGIYFENFGMRTEIDVYIKNGQPFISGRDRQYTLLDCKG